MKKSKDLNDCRAKLQALQRRDDLTPEQRKYVDRAVFEVRSLGRLSHPTRAEAVRAVRRISEALIRAFIND